MANIRLIRRRIKSAQNISQITKAMEMVSASKMKRAQEKAVNGKPYAEKIHEAVVELARRAPDLSHPLLSRGNPKGSTLVVLISTNKGLCGGLNTNLFRTLAAWQEGRTTEYVTLGKKGEQFIVRLKGHLTADFSETLPFVSSVGAIAKLVVEGFTNGTYKEVFLAYNMFFSALKQMPTVLPLLPLAPLKKDDTEADGADIAEFVVEPSIQDVFESLLPHFIENQIRSAILEAEASEHSARMIAMKNATDAALDFVSELTLQYNKARQERITNEIADLVTARMAL